MFIKKQTKTKRLSKRNTIVIQSNFANIFICHKRLYYGKKSEVIMSNVVPLVVCKNLWKLNKSNYIIFSCSEIPLRRCYIS